MICIACLLKNSCQLICHNIKFVVFFRRTLIFVNRFNEISYKSTSRFISDLQSIKLNRLIRIRKFQIRKVFNNIRSRKWIVSNSYLSLNNSKNRSFYHTKHRSFFVCIFLKYRTFRHINRSLFLVANFRFARFFYLLSMSFLFSRMFVAFASIFSNSTMICIVIYELFISIMYFVEIMKIYENIIANTIAISTIIDEKLSHFFTFFAVLLIDFFIHERMYQQTTCIDCENEIFFLFVNICYDKFAHRTEIKISWQKRINILTVWSIFAFCFLNNNNWIIFIIHLLHVLFCFNKQTFDFVIRIMTSSFKMRDLDIRRHETWKYVIANIYLFDMKNDKTIISIFRRELHLIDDLKINMLINNDIMKSKKSFRILSKKQFS